MRSTSSSGCARSSRRGAPRTRSPRASDLRQGDPLRVVGDRRRLPHALPLGLRLPRPPRQPRRACHDGLERGLCSPCCRRLVLGIRPRSPAAGGPGETWKSGGRNTSRRRPMRERIGVIGGGSWGTALAKLLADKGYPVTLWVHDPERCARDRGEARERDLSPRDSAARQPDPLDGSRARSSRGKTTMLCVVPSTSLREVMTARGAARRRRAARS